MRILKNHGYVLFLNFLKSLRDDEKPVIHLLLRSYQGLEGLKEQKSTFHTFL